MTDIPAEHLAELTTVGSREAVVHRALEVERLDGLAPGSTHELAGFEFETLPEPGERLATFATVNDVHFGEEVCGLVHDNPDVGPVFRSEPGEPPYPETMNAGAVEEISAVDPAVVLVKGDLTATGTHAEYERFVEVWQGAFGARLLHVRGNHDAYYGATFADMSCQRVDLPGATLAMLDTTVPGQAGGGLTADQIEWLDELAATADRPVLVFGHHHAWNPASSERPDPYFGVHPDWSERLVEVVARRPRIAGYFAGHTHRNRVRHFAATGTVPWVEVACVKDYPGAWAEYRVHEGGVLQIVHRISTPAALAWTERTRHMFAGMYGTYALGALADRCFAIATDR
ncbi:MAG: metallophosphoesterase [Actinobacteria bacterium]|nr:metallophosphoesterase [Actinomycetota bacterium]